VYSPPAIPEMTTPLATMGAPVALYPSRQSANVWFHTCLPVAMSSATRWLSIVTRNSLPL
jgi:hypothetical protein